MSSRKNLLLWMLSLLLMAVGLRAAYWQHGRALEKEAQAKQFAAVQSSPTAELVTVAPLTLQDKYRRVLVRGHFVAGKSVWLENQMQEGQAGLLRLALFAIDRQGGFIVVNRGWVASDASRQALPDVPPESEQPVMLIGRLNSAPVRFKLGGVSSSGPVILDAEPAYLSARWGVKLPPLWLQQTEGLGQGFAASLTAPDFKVAMHIGYMWQWLAFSMLTLIFAVILTRRSRSH